MCRVLVSCADFEAILTPFSVVIGNRLFLLLKAGMERQTTSWIAGQTSLRKALSPQKEKSRIAKKQQFHKAQ